MEFKRVLLTTIAVLMVLVIIVPFLVPVKPLNNTRPVEELVGPDSRFVEMDGVKFHYLDFGEGTPVLVLLHGFAASTFSWREVIPPLAENHRVIAFDRPAAGFTERPLEWEGENPYSLASQARQTMALMDALDVERAVLMGNSAGGTIAALAALEFGERVEALVLVDAALITTGGASSWIKPLYYTPQADHLGPLFVRSIQSRGRDFAEMAWYDPAKITPEIWKGYTAPLNAENWDRGLWELVRASRNTNLASRLQELDLPVLVISGEEDQIVPVEDSVHLASEIQGAVLTIFPTCGHIPHEECPQLFLDAVNLFLAGLE